MPTTHAPSSNRLLASLDAVALGRLLPHLTLLKVASGTVLFESGTPQALVYFPVTATISLHYLAANGTVAAISLVGEEGVIGIPLFLQEKILPCSAVVRDAGYAFQISAAVLTSELNRPGPALRLVLAYARELNAQLSQAAHCDVHGVPDQKSCSDCAHAARCPVAK